MARYIDADKAMEEINRIGGHNLCEWETIGVKALIDRQPTADVAPRAEVAREIFEEIETALKLYKRYDLRSGTYFECYLEAAIAELKKKYVEGQK